MAKKPTKETVEEAPKLPSDLIVATTELGEDMWVENDYPASPIRVTAVPVPDEPKVDVNKVLFEMIVLLGTVGSFEGQARVVRAVAAFYNLTEEI